MQFKGTKDLQNPILIGVAAILQELNKYHYKAILASFAQGVSEKRSHLNSRK